MKAKNFTVTPKLDQVNAFRVANGLAPIAAVKTAKQNKKQQAANRAAHAARQQAIRNLRNSNKKGL